ncbi:hypothetical protein BLOT_013230 [Blomia tropicalis]|nr:hypothetical protein BLOT_013230 [Blomia tropicalis]
MYKETTLKELSTSWNIEYGHRISSIRPKFMNWRNEIQSTSVDTFNRRELRAMYEKPYKVLTSSSGKVESETRVEAKDQRSTEFNRLR